MQQGTKIDLFAANLTIVEKRSFSLSLIFSIKVFGMTLLRCLERLNKIIFSGLFQDTYVGSSKYKKFKTMDIPRNFKASASIAVFDQSTPYTLIF